MEKIKDYLGFQNWIKGAYHNKQGHCVMGAMEKTMGQADLKTATVIANSIKTLFPKSKAAKMKAHPYRVIMAFNDNSKRTWKDIKRVLDHANV